MSMDWLEATHRPPRSLCDATECAKALRAEVQKLLEIVSGFGGTGSTVESSNSSTPCLSRVVSDTGSRVAMFNAQHAQMMSWLNLRLTQCYEAMDSSDRCVERTKLTQELGNIEADLNALQSWARHERHQASAAHSTPWSESVPAREFKKPHRQEPAQDDANVLPDGWDIAWSHADGRFFFYNRLRGISQWEKPSAARTQDAGTAGYNTAAAPSPPDTQLKALETRLQLTSTKSCVVEQTLRRAIESGFAPNGYGLVQDQRKTLASVRDDFLNALQDLDDLRGDDNTRDRKRAITHKIDKDLKEVEELDKHLERLLQLFQMLHL